MGSTTTIPAGTVTFWFTDIEGSTRLWEQCPELMPSALARHDAILRHVVNDNNGYLFKTTGDGIAAAFAIAPDAVNAALTAQRAMLAEPWPGSIVLRSRMGLHTGAAESRDGDYFGPTLSRAARLMAAGHGGQTLLSEAAQELSRDVLPADVTLAALGKYRLKDLARPENVYQLGHPELMASFPPLRTLDNPDLPNNLPRQLTSFIGREKDIAHVSALLRSWSLLTLTGPGGTGKTRLSLQVAADMLEEYPDGVWQVELAPLSDPALVAQTVAAALGIREIPGQPVRQTLLDHLKTKNLLLLLDNTEHLISPSADLAAAVLKACPRVKILVTSREPLGIGGEHIYRVPALSLPDPHRTYSSSVLSQYESVQLFIDRAQLVRSDFTVTNTNAPALAELCHRLDGIPLAIELAAVRMRSLAVEQINDRLDTRFRLLTGGDRSALPRQQTLRALVDWSYDLLNERERMLYARLSMFAGGCTLASAESVCGFGQIEDWEVLDLLSSLVDKSLVIADEEKEGAGIGRYRMLETLREYAIEKREQTAESAELRSRHAAHYESFAVESGPKIMGPEQSLWLNKFETEHDNLRSAVAASWTASESILDVSITAILSGLRICGALWRFWYVRGYFGEGREQLARVLQAYRSALTKDAAATEELSEAAAQALNAAGILANSQSDFGPARAFYEESLALSRGLGDEPAVARTLGNLALLSHYEGDLNTALSLGRESLAYHRKRNDRRLMAMALNNLGSMSMELGEYDSARAELSESLDLLRELDDRVGIPSVLGNLGNVAILQRDYVAAREMCQETLDRFRESGDKRGMANTLNSLGNICRHEQDYAEARSMYDQSLSLFREVGEKRGIAQVLGDLGMLASDLQDHGTAKTSHEESLRYSREIGDRTSTSNTLDHLGGVAFTMHDFATAQTAFQESLALRRDSDDRRGSISSLESIADVAFELGDYRRAVVLWSSAGAFRAATGTPLPPTEQEAAEAKMSHAETVLGADLYAASVEEGAAWAWEEAVAFALEA